MNDVEEGSVAYILLTILARGFLAGASLGATGATSRVNGRWRVGPIFDTPRPHQPLRRRSICSPWRNRFIGLSETGGKYMSGSPAGGTLQVERVTFSKAVAVKSIYQKTIKIFF